MDYKLTEKEIISSLILNSYEDDSYGTSPIYDVCCEEKLLTTKGNLQDAERYVLSLGKLIDKTERENGYFVYNVETKDGVKVFEIIRY